MIAVNNVSRRFGQLVAVHDVSFQVEAGEIFGLVGPDGAGKTTTLRMITGIVEITSGSITLLGANNAEAVKEQLGYVPQKFSLYGDLTVMENIRLMGALYGADENQIEARANEILAFTQLLPFKNRLADHLSGGMKQKLALAAGLMHKPKVFFLDEPTTGVDPVSRREFWHMLYRLNKEGMTIVVSTPYMDEAELCTRIAFMHQGRIVACNSPEGLKKAYPYKLLELYVNNKNIKEILIHCPVLDMNPFGEKYHLVVASVSQAKTSIKAALKKAGVNQFQLEEIRPGLEDVFVHLAEGGNR